MDDLLYVLLGAVLSYIATTIARKDEEKRVRSRERQTFWIRLNLTLESLVSSLEKLKDSYSNKNFFEFLKIDVVEARISELHELKKEIQLVDPRKQEVLLALIGDASFLNADIKGMESWFLNSLEEVGKPNAAFSRLEDHRAHFDRLRVQKLIDIVEVKRRIDAFLREN